MSVADSQGGIGHILCQALLNELAARGPAGPRRVRADPRRRRHGRSGLRAARPSRSVRSTRPSRPTIGRRSDGWTMIEDSGRGYRRVVASPEPMRIVESAQIRTLVDAGFVVIAVGGGGVAVVETAPGRYRGVEAVIDKDRASALLGASLDDPAPRPVDRRRAGRRPVPPAGRALARPDHRRARPRATSPTASSRRARWARRSRRRSDSWSSGGEEVLITTPASLERAIAGETGTRIVPDRRGEQHQAHRRRPDR